MKTRERTERDGDTGRRTSENETLQGPKRGGKGGGKGPFRGGRRSNEPTSHGVVPTRAFSLSFTRVSSFFSAVAYQVSSASLFFSLLGFVALVPSLFLARLYYSYFHAHVLRLCGSTIYVLSDLPAPVTIRPRRNAKLFDGKSHRSRFSE